MTTQPSRFQAMTNAKIALCDQLPPAYAHPIGRLVAKIADSAVSSATFNGPRSMDHAAAACDALTELLDELTDAVTTQTRADPALAAVARAETAARYSEAVSSAAHRG